MFFLQIIFQMVRDWCRDLAIDILGDRAEAFFGRIVRRKRRERRRARRVRRTKSARQKGGFSS